MEIPYRSFPFLFLRSLLPNHSGKQQLTDICLSKREKKLCIILQEGERLSCHKLKGISYIGKSFIWYQRTPTLTEHCLCEDDPHGINANGRLFVFLEFRRYIDKHGLDQDD